MDRQWTRQKTKCTRRFASAQKIIKSFITLFSMRNLSQWSFNYVPCVAGIMFRRWERCTVSARCLRGICLSATWWHVMLRITWHYPSFFAQSPRPNRRDVVLRLTLPSPTATIFSSRVSTSRQSSVSVWWAGLPRSICHGSRSGHCVQRTIVKADHWRSQTKTSRYESINVMR